MRCFLCIATLIAAWLVCEHALLAPTSWRLTRHQRATPLRLELSEAPLQAEQASILREDDDGSGGASSNNKKTTAELVSDFFMQAKAAGRQPLERSGLEKVNVQFINEIRKRGCNLLDEIAALPSSRQEAWKYTSLKTLFGEYGYVPVPSTASPTAAMKAKIAKYVDEGCKESCLVFLDGLYCAELSNTKAVPQGVTLNSLGNLDADLFTPVLDQIGSTVVDMPEMPRNSFASDVMSSLGASSTIDGAVLRVPKNTKVEVPLQVLFYSTADSLTRHVAAFPRLLIDIDTNSEARIKQTFVGGEGEGDDTSVVQTGAMESSNLVLSNTKVSVAQGAHLQHTYEQDLPLSSRHLEVIDANVLGEASYGVTILQMGSKLGRVNAHINVTEASANCTLNGITMAHTKQTLDLHSSITHGATGQVSRQQQRNVVGEGGEAIFKGRIRIPQQAQQTDSDQLCRSLMLGERARVIAMPTLEITADDVTCSHGASIADLDENSMFYLSARGIDRREARKLLLRGFVLELVKDDLVDKFAERRISSKLEMMNPKDANLLRRSDGSEKSAQNLFSM